MSISWKPEGYPVVSPYLITRNAQGVIDFLKEVFSATELRRHDRPDGSVMHAEVRIGDSVIMMGEAGDEWEPVSANLHVYVEDVDTTYRRALAAGGVSVQEPERKDDSDRRGGIKDPGGNSWWIATQVG